MRIRGWTAALVTIVATATVIPAGSPAAAGSTGEAGRPGKAGSSDWKQVSAGALHSCGIRVSGRLYCWGSDSSGQLGDGGANLSQLAPVQVAGGETDWVSVAAGGNFSCGLRTTGRLYCWGSDANGEVGDGGSAQERSVPTQVAGGSTTWASVSAGLYHACALRTSGRLYCWGSDSRGQLGDGQLGGVRMAPAQVAGSRQDWAAVSTGSVHTCALRTSGRAYCWGLDETLQLGDGPGDSTTATPVQVSGGRTDWVEIRAGGSHTCARRVTGRVFCWGGDDRGQLGDGAPDLGRGVPAEVTGRRTDWTKLALGTSHTCGLRASGRLFCWGDDSAGALGNGDPLADSAVPVQVAGGATDWVSISSLFGHTCATTTARRLYCWGLNDAGQLGAATPVTWSSEPVETHA